MSLATWRKALGLLRSPRKHQFDCMGQGCVIYPGAKIVGAKNILLGDAVMIDDFTFLHIKKSLLLSSFVHIGAYSSIGGNERCMIGSFTSLSWGVRIFTSTEDLDHLFGPMIPADMREVIEGPVRIGDHVLIGANSVILPGAIIGNGVVIGAGSVVTKNQDISPWSIWAGSPARFIKFRDSQHIVLEAEDEIRRRYYGQV